MYCIKDRWKLRLKDKVQITLQIGGICHQVMDSREDFEGRPPKLPTRKRKAYSCTECVRRKRQCDRQIPGCSQCRMRGEAHKCKWGDERDTHASSLSSKEKISEQSSSQKTAEVIPTLLDNKDDESLVRRLASFLSNQSIYPYHLSPNSDHRSYLTSCRKKASGSLPTLLLRCPL